MGQITDSNRKKNDIKNVHQKGVVPGSKGQDPICSIVYTLTLGKTFVFIISLENKVD